MSHIVLHCAQFSSVQKAEIAAQRLNELRQSYIDWSNFRFSKGESLSEFPQLLFDFAEKHGFDWPRDKKNGFLIKGDAEEIQVVVIGALVFFYAGGFSLGGTAMLNFFRVVDATHYATHCHLLVSADDPDGASKDLAAFLDAEDYEEQYAIKSNRDELESLLTLHSVRFISPKGKESVLGFGDVGVQDWAFVSAIYQLDSGSPTLDADHEGTTTF